MTTCRTRTSSSRKPSRSKAAPEGHLSEFSRSLHCQCALSMPAAPEASCTAAISKGVGPASFDELTAPAHWRAVDFISDLHLHASEPQTFQAWSAYLQNTQADALIILGDLFEVWVGDDLVVEAKPTALQGEFERQCAALIKAASQRLDVFFMRGNRDFLVGQALMSQCGARLLTDPTVLCWKGQRWLLSHGDALCLADAPYQAFRALVRSEAWQRDFLAQPLSQRLTIARGLRAQSEARKKSSPEFIDVDDAAARQWLFTAGASVLIHGHTHRPAEHDLGNGLRRIVLSDWDASSLPARTEVLRLSESPSLDSVPDTRKADFAPATFIRYYINSKLFI